VNLSKKSSSSSHIPYRQSKLTNILKDSIGNLIMRNCEMRTEKLEMYEINYKIYDSFHKIISSSFHNFIQNKKVEMRTLYLSPVCIVKKDLSG